MPTSPRSSRATSSTAGARDWPDRPRTRRCGACAVPHRAARAHGARRPSTTSTRHACAQLGREHERPDWVAAADFLGRVPRRRQRRRASDQLDPGRARAVRRQPRSRRGEPGEPGRGRAARRRRRPPGGDRGDVRDPAGARPAAASRSSRSAIRMSRPTRSAAARARRARPARRRAADRRRAPAHARSTCHRHGPALRASRRAVTDRIGTAAAGTQRAAAGGRRAARPSRPIARSSGSTPRRRRASGPPSPGSCASATCCTASPWRELAVVVRSRGQLAGRRVAHSRWPRCRPARHRAASRCATTRRRAPCSRSSTSAIGRARRSTRRARGRAARSARSAGSTASALRRLRLALRAEELAGGGDAPSDELLVEASRQRRVA